MYGRALDCLSPDGAAARPVHTVRPAALESFLASLPPVHARFLRQAGFTAEAHEPPMLLAADGVAAAVLGLGEDRSRHTFGGLAATLPEGDWHLEPGDYDPPEALLGFCLGAYHYPRFRAPARPPARLVPPPDTTDAAQTAATIWMVRDLINAPANVLGPAELAEAAAEIGHRFGAAVTLTTGAALATAYPAIAAVGAAATRPACVVLLEWTGSQAPPDAPLISLCGKGVVFDTGGLDLKPSAAMLRMKKDMGGAAILLGVARELMRRDLPLRLALRLGCVENAVAGAAMRPGDVIRTRAGLTVEIGNTDAEGRLVLADLLAEACQAHPAMLIDCATLTGAARVATGPDLPVLFSDDETLAEALLAAGLAAHDPLWRLPLWSGYAPWLASPIADLCNVSQKTVAGAIVAALFLRRFVTPAVPWAHVDAYAWNDSTRPGRPEGGEAQALRAICGAIDRLFPARNRTASLQ